MCMALERGLFFFLYCSLAEKWGGGREGGLFTAKRSHLPVFLCIKLYLGDSNSIESMKQ